MAATNALAGVNLQAIAQETARTLLPKLGGLKYFTLDLSNDIAQKGASVTSRVVSRYTSADVSGGYAAAVQNTTTTPITVTLDHQYGVVLDFSDAEVSKSSVDLQRMVYEPLANAAAYDAYNLAFSKVVSSNFAAYNQVAASSFDSDSLIDVKSKLNKAFVPEDRRVFIGNSDIFANLQKDTSFKAAYAYGSNGVIVEGSLNKALGFEMMEFSWLPDNSENLIGFGCGPQGIAIAARRLADPVAWYGEVEDIEIAGIPFQLRRWYSGDDGLLYISMANLMGVSPAVAGNIVRVVSA